MVNERGRDGPEGGKGPVTIFGPDFPFAFDDWIAHPAGLGSIPAERHGEEVAVVGAGVSGLVAAYELMKLGVKPVVYEASRLGGRLRSQAFQGAEGMVADLGGMRFPVSSTCFYHYVDMLGLRTRPFPNPLTEAAGSTVIDLEGVTHYARTLEDLPPLFTEVADAWAQALEEVRYTAIQDAIRARDVPALKSLWNDLVLRWDDRTFYDFVASSKAFSSLSFHHREIFGHVGFGTGGWDSDYPNSMLEIFRVVMTNCDTDQRLVVGGAEQVPRGIWGHRAPGPAHWPAGTSLRRAEGRRREDRARPRRPARGHRRLGRHPPVPGGADHLPELAAHHADRMRGVAVLPEDMGGPGSHPLHAVVQDLRPGRPAVLEG
jgi:lysine 2-monooxygenase